MEELQAKDHRIGSGLSLKASRLRARHRKIEVMESYHQKAEIRNNPLIATLMGRVRPDFPLKYHFITAFVGHERDENEIEKMRIDPARSKLNTENSAGPYY